MANASFDRFSPETKDLMRLMLLKDPAKRCTPEQALQHPYFVKNGFLAEPATVIPKLKNTNLSVIAEDLSSEDGKRLSNNSTRTPFKTKKLTIDTDLAQRQNPQHVPAKLEPVNRKSISVNEMNDEGNLEDSKSDGSQHGATNKNLKPRETTYGKVTKTNRSQSIRYKKIQGDFQIARHMELFFDDEEQSPLKGIVKNKTNK